MAITYHAGRRIQGLSTDLALTTIQGYDGGRGTVSTSGAGGGGSATVGSDATSTNGGNGGTGTQNDILTGSNAYYSSGGGGGSWGSKTYGTGSNGGANGGNGGTGSNATGYGNGGGGGGNNGSTGYNGGNGSQGIVILRFTTSGNTYSQAGGTVDTSTIAGQTIIKWTATSGTTTFTPSASFDVRYLVVGGGAGGGWNVAGGGGAGGYRTATGHEVTAKTYTITVGALGGGAGTSQYYGSSGGDSTFDTITSIGGGGGGSAGNANGQLGASGGGGSGASNATGQFGLGTTTVTDLKPTNVQVGSRLEETDTRKMYHYEPQVPDYDYPMTTDPRTNTWNVSGYSTITHANSTLQLNLTSGTSGNGAGSTTYIDLGSTLSNKWVMRFKTKQNSFSAYGYNSHHLVGLSSSPPSGTGHVSTSNWIGTRWYYGIQWGANNTNKQGIEPRISKSSSGDHNNSTSVDRLYGRPNTVSDTTTSYYHEYIWNVDTFTYNLYTNENYTGTPAATATLDSSTNTQWVSGTPSTITGLRYLVHYIGADTAEGTFVSQLDDVEIWDGVIVAATGNAWKEEGT